jgi:uncharacterized protein
MSDTNKTFLGNGLGWPLDKGLGTETPSGPITTDGSGALVRAGYEESVRQSVWLILSTAPGERLMRPTFGCGIHELVFAPLTDATISRVTESVHSALLTFEPRIDVISVRVNPGSDGELLIDIQYEVRTTNNVFNLVYPFYLQGAA